MSTPSQPGWETILRTTSWWQPVSCSVQRKSLSLQRRAESGDDKWQFAKLAALAGSCVRRGGAAAHAIDIWRKGLDCALAELGAGEASEQRDHQERLELLMNLVLAFTNPADFARLPRLDYILQTPAAERAIMDKCFAMFWPAFLHQLMCDN